MAHGLDVSWHPDEEAGSTPEQLLICREGESSPRSVAGHLIFLELWWWLLSNLVLSIAWTRRGNGDPQGTALVYLDLINNPAEFSHTFSHMLKQMWQISIWIVLISENPWNVYWTFHPLLGDIFIKGRAELKLFCTDVNKHRSYWIKITHFEVTLISLIAM